MEHQLLSYRQSEISCFRFGAGAKTVLCFHGYGESGMLFSFLEKYAGETHSFYAIDLPFHGKTSWREERRFTLGDLDAITRQLFNTAVNYTLIGFSLGARVALDWYEYNSTAIDRMVLMAPDGLKVNFWYWLSTQTRMGNKLFKYSMRHPGWFFSLLKMLNRLKFVNASIFKFVNYYIHDNEARQLLFNRWTTLSGIKPDLAKIKILIRENQTPVRLVYGKYDRIILPGRGQKFREGVEDFCRLDIIDSGHQVLHENHVNPLLHALLD
jgi:pimeloyl-ACP methyl ester carboxylesterase